MQRIYYESDDKDNLGEISKWAIFLVRMGVKMSKDILAKK